MLKACLLFSVCQLCHCFCQAHPNERCEERRCIAQEVLRGADGRFGVNAATWASIFPDEFRCVADTGQVLGCFFKLTDEIGGRLVVHSGDVEWADSVLEGILKSAPNVSHHLPGARKQTTLSSPP